MQWIVVLEIEDFLYENTYPLINHKPTVFELMIFSNIVDACLGPVLLTLLRHVARILANGRAAFFESCDAIGWNSCDVSQKR